MSSKVQQFKNAFLDRNGLSNMIKRYELPEGLYYTSGDGLFRSDATLGNIYKFARFTKNFPNTLIKRISDSWKLTITEEDKQLLIKDYNTLIFPNKGDKNYDPRKSNSAIYIKFYGIANSEIINNGIRSDIVKEIKKLSCCNCGTTKDVECDHKNDLWKYNDLRLGIKEKQTIQDFQPLCKHCNSVKRAVKMKTLKEHKRQSSPGFPIQFTNGSDYFNKTDPYWYKGTYWGDIKDFKHNLNLYKI